MPPCVARNVRDTRRRGRLATGIAFFGCILGGAAFISKHGHSVSYHQIPLRTGDKGASQIVGG
jgi:hypothetical protein